MRYAPAVFWNMALREFLLAVEGYAEARGAKPKGAGGGPAMMRAELDELDREYPDTPVPPR